MHPEPEGGGERPDFWDFPKGLLDGGEKGIDAAVRETKEETGIHELEFVPEFKETVHYFTRREGKSIPKFVALFLARSQSDAVALSWEHDRFEWLPYEEARECLTRPEMKKALEKAEQVLQRADS